MRIAIVRAIIIVKFVVYDYYKYYGIVSIAKEIAQERAKYCQANWDTRRYILPPWEESTVHLWIEYCMDMLEQPLEISISREQYLLKEICEFIAPPPPGNVVEIMIKEAYNLADNKHQIFRTRHIAYVAPYYRIGMYKSAIGSVCNIPWDMTDSSYTTPAEKRKIIRAVNKYISEVL